VVNVAGNTDLNGITDWLVGDWAVYNGTVWQKVDNTDSVTSVNGLTGTVVLTTTNIAEGTNLYYTDARARAAISAGTGISYDNSTGVVTNAAPDQTVALTDGTAIDVTGTYPNFTINNTAPDQTVVLTAGTGISTSGTYPNFTIANTAPSLGGDVVGPASATDNAIARYDTTTGKLIQNSVIIVDDTGSVTGVNALTAQSLTVNNNATLGSSNTDSLDVRARISSDLDPETNNAKDIGSSGRNWRDAFFGRTVHTVNLELTGTTSFDGSQGTSGQVLTSAGTGNTPTWTTPTTGTVTSVDVSGGTTGLTTSGGPVTGSGTITLAGTLAVANGGTGLTSLTANRVPYGNDTSAYQSSANLTFNGTTLTAPVLADSQGGSVAPISSVMRNRIINGAMVIDQRNAGASVNLNAGFIFPVDRWRSGPVAQTWGTGVVAAQQQVDAPAGFYNSVKLTVSTADTSLAATDGYGFIQQIEANNLYDLNWGTADAKTVTLSFWVKSSITGTYAGSLVHNGSTPYSYVYTYSIPVANTWTYINVTVPGQTTNNTPTTGTVAGISVVFDLGSGSNVTTTAGAWTSGTLSRTTGSTNWISNSGATLFLTGVQLEVGTQATGFEYRQYGTELALCYRYYRRYVAGSTLYTSLGVGISTSASAVNRMGWQLDIPMRTAPTVSATNCVAWNGVVGGAFTATTQYSSATVVDFDGTTSGMSAGTLTCKLLLINDVNGVGHVQLNGAEL
jgi:hypothetical protein